MNPALFSFLQVPAALQTVSTMGMDYCGKRQESQCSSSSLNVPCWQEPCVEHQSNSERYHLQTRSSHQREQDSSHHRVRVRDLHNKTALPSYLFRRHQLSP